NSSLGGKGFNEIRFEDKKGQEQIAIFAEKDIDNRVKNDRREHINHDRHLIVEKERFEHIKNNKHLIIEKNQNIEIGQSAHLNVGQTHHTTVGQDFYLEAGNEIHIKAGNKMVFDAGEVLSMKAGGSVMKTSAGGVGFNGATIRINEGGSPGTGSGASPVAPQKPQIADKDYPGYKARARKAMAKHVPLRLMEQNIPPEPKPLPPKTYNPELLTPPIIPEEPFYFSAQLRDHNNEILSGIAYELTLDDKEYKGTTNGEGFIEFEIMKKPKELALSYRPVSANPDYIEYWKGSIDTLTETTKGQQRKLQQQGYYPGDIDGADMGKTSSAWSKFSQHQEKQSRNTQRLNNPDKTANQDKDEK
ncbi:MAG: hypothetical protein GY694_01440, partial [Gammaproteobacteria bacterium]|nr:hypothetical protein [Gammaproteobacteria bacterium]